MDHILGDQCESCIFQCRNGENMSDRLEKYQRVYAVVNLDAAIENMESMKANLKPETKMLAVIKADGYGHGALPLARELGKLHYVFGYAVATVEEALTLRQAGLKKPILILGYAFPYCYEDLVREDIRPAVFRADMAKELSETAIRLGKKLKIHIKVDTGMSRIGISPDESGLLFVKQVMELPGLELEGIFTHFARADEEDKTSVEQQFKRFQVFVEKLERAGISVPMKHCANSAAILELPEMQLDMVRAGIALYGLWPSGEDRKDRSCLKPLLSLYSHITYVKDVPAGTPISYGGTYVTDSQRRIATVPVGYGDGYPRGLSNKAAVLLHGKRAPVCGRICMDQFMVDVTGIPETKEGDLVTLIGTDGNEQITIEELGMLSGRFHYELACCLGERIPRVYRKHGEYMP